MRITKNAFNNLALFMIGFGVITGLVFPFAVITVGVPAKTALSPLFFSFAVSAGFVVGGVNILLAKVLLRPKLTLMADHMRDVEAGLTAATYTGDWSRCDPEECSIPVTSDDEFGVAAKAFNQLLVALVASHEVEARLSEFTEAMSADLDVGATCQAAIDYFRTDLGAAGVAILGEGAHGLRVLASHGIKRPESLLEADLVRSAMQSLESDSMNLPAHLVIDAAVAMLTPEHVDVYPLVVSGNAIGAVVLASSEETPSGARALGPLFIRTLSVAVANALAHERMQHAASYDSMLEILNRRAGLELLRTQFVKSISHEPLSAVMIDLDHFKLINDGHGHLAGDAVLRGVVASVRSVLRSDDVLVRYGGEELLVILPGATIDAAGRVSERIREAVAKHPIVFDGTAIPVTVSVGFSSTSDISVADEMALVGAADEALYEAKRAGRNQARRAAA